MGYFEAIILGLVQGATEYLPVSSSGHLVLVPWLFGFDKAPFTFDVLVQMGTLVGVLVYYRQRLWEVVEHTLKGVATGRPFATPQARFGWYVVVATVPAAVIGLLFKQTFEETFASPRASMGFLLVTATLLVLAEKLSPKGAYDEPGKRDESELTLLDAIVVGCFQAFALFPGVSRSGSTIAGGMLRGLKRTDATNFSFVMSIPVMVGAGVLTLRDLLEQPEQLKELAGPLVVGFLVSAVSGYIVIRFFLQFVRRRGLLPFAAYCFLVGAGGLLALSLSDGPPGEAEPSSALEVPEEAPPP